jgi:chemotaxis methyl-accepting protein methylase
VFEEYIKKEE